MEAVKQEQKRKGGRPFMPVKRNITVGIRFSKVELGILQQKAKAAGIKTGSFIRQIALTGKVQQKVTEAEMHIIRQLVGMANNLNQLAKKAYQEGIQNALIGFEVYRNQIDQLLKMLGR
jgi:hypothetical protein